MSDNEQDRADALADAYFAGRPRRGRKLRAPESADALAKRLQLADLARGEEPVESRVRREVEARRVVARRITEEVGR